MTDNPDLLLQPLPAGAKFPLGRVVITPSAARLPAALIERCLARHQAGDWGDVLADVAGDNAEALRNGWAVMSDYFKRGPSFSIVTDGDRSTTTVSTPWDWRL
jgi:hypothetical protein